MKFLLALHAAAAITTLPLSAEIISATGITVPVPPGNTSATLLLGGNRITISNLFGAILSAADCSGADFAAAPLAANQSALSYEVRSQPRITSEFPISGLLVYPLVFRGSAANTASPLYGFSHTFTILSGMVGTTKIGDVLLCPAPAPGFYSGILHFPTTATSLNIETNSTAFASQGITFAIDDAPPTVATARRLRIRPAARRITLTGTAFAPIGIRTVQIAVKGTRFQSASGAEAWTKKLRTAQIGKRILIRATSASGKTSSLTKIRVARG